MNDLSWVPPQVARLAPREREIATVIYTQGASTARDVEARLDQPISNSAVRTMLTRMVKKGILRRVGGRRGRGEPCIYTPSITPEDVKRRALEQVANLYFGGSLASMTIGLVDLLTNSEDLDDVRAKITAPPPCSPGAEGLGLAA